MFDQALLMLGATSQGAIQRMPAEDVVLLTGATGALGAHILHQLLQNSHVRHVYCLAGGDADPRERVLESLA